jgi:hypothetical protein
VADTAGSPISMESSSVHVPHLTVIGSNIVAVWYHGADQVERPPL